MNFSHIEKEKGKNEYHEHKLMCNEDVIYFRKAKITPIKLGQFVTFYKKINNVNTPLCSDDNIDYLIVNVSDGFNRGLFIFPKEVLIEQKIICSKLSKGKMAFRIYPPWVKELSKQSSLTQKWQVKYFVLINDENFNKFKVLLSL